MYKLDLEKAEEPEINLPYLLDHRKSKGILKKDLLLLIDYTKAFDCADHNKLWKIPQEMGIPDDLSCLLQVKKQQLQLDMEQWTGSKLGKEYAKAVYCYLLI